MFKPVFKLKFARVKFVIGAVKMLKYYIVKFCQQKNTLKCIVSFLAYQFYLNKDFEQRLVI